MAWKRSLFYTLVLPIVSGPLPIARFIVIPAQQFRCKVAYIAASWAGIIAKNCIPSCTETFQFVLGGSMNKCWPEDKIMCETSEETPGGFSSSEIEMITLAVRQRIAEGFAFQDISNMVFPLKANIGELRTVLDGRALPSTELLLNIRNATNISIDWLLAGEGPKSLSAPDPWIHFTTSCISHCTSSCGSTSSAGCLIRCAYTA